MVDDPLHEGVGGAGGLPRPSDWTVTWIIWPPPRAAAARAVPPLTAFVEMPPRMSLGSMPHCLATLCTVASECTISLTVSGSAPIRGAGCSHRRRAGCRGRALRSPARPGRCRARRGSRSGSRSPRRRAAATSAPRSRASSGRGRPLPRRPIRRERPGRRGAQIGHPAPELSDLAAGAAASRRSGRTPSERPLAVGDER